MRQDRPVSRIPAADHPLEPWPIVTEEVLEGDPQMRGCILALSRDGRHAAGLWEAQPSRMRGGYASQEVDLVLRGRATVTPAGGEPYEVAAGDVLVVPAGTRCEWHIHEAVRKLFTGRALPRSMRDALAGRAR
jgi:uncharacterized cupin superfamily protein